VKSGTARRVALLFTLAVMMFAGATAAADPYIDGVRTLAAGANAGFGADRLPDVALGPPQGGGATAGSADVVSLGNGGIITLVFRDNAVVDGPGDDLVVFENAFHVGSRTGPVFTEYGFVQVSADGRNFRQFPVDLQNFSGLAGQTAVLANSANGLDPFDAASGGDRFDLADVGLSYARYVRIVDAGDDIDDIGNHVLPGDKGGFDLDACGAIHSADLVKVIGAVRFDGLPVSHAIVRLIPDGDGKPMRVRSRHSGVFRFRRVIPSGPYTITAERRRLGRGSTMLSIEEGSGVLTVEVDIDSGTSP